MNIKQKILTTNWHVFHKRHRSVFLQSILMGPSILNPKAPFNHRVRFLGDLCNTIIIDKKEMERLAHKTIKHLKKDPRFLLKLMGQAYKQRAAYEKEWNSIRNANFATFSNTELARALKKYMDQLLGWGIYVSLPLFVESYLEQEVKASFQNIFKNLAQEYINLVFSPVKNGSVLEEELALLKLAKKGNVSEIEIQKHAENFCWMANVEYMENYHPVSYYRQRLKQYKTKNPSKLYKEIVSHRAEHKKKFNMLLRKIKDPLLKTLVQTTNEAIYFRSYRTEMYYSSARVFTNLFKEVANRLGFREYRDILWFYPRELNTFLTGTKKIPKNLVKTRKKGFSFLSDFNGNYWHWDGSEAKKVYNLFLQSQKNIKQQTNKITGSSAYPGKAQGKVVVTNTLAELNKVKKGHILVTHATNVNYVTALKKVSAIVTEEGGILSHAAIISREMRIPCIIGTKTATKVFKDGDMVEVDANKGTVRKINEE